MDALNENSIDNAVARLLTPSKQAELQLKLEAMKFEREKFEWMKKKEAAELGLEAQQKRPVGIGDSKLRMSGE